MLLSNLAAALTLPSSIFCLPHVESPAANDAAMLAERAALAQPELVHRFPLSTWVENLAVRASGKVLTTFISPTASIYQVDPTKPTTSNAELVHTFKGVSSVLGIAEGERDVFYVSVGNYSAANGGKVGTWSIWSADLTKCEHAEDAVVNKIVDIPEAELLNGVDFVDRKKGILLVTDSTKGVVYSLNVHTKEVRVAINETQTHGPGELGINGIRVRHDGQGKPIVFFTNSGTAALYKQKVNKDGTPAEPAKPVYTSTTAAFEPDDFALDAKQDAYIANFATDNIVLHKAGSDSIRNITQLLGCTSAQFGRSKKDVREGVLYISSSGGDAQYASGNITNPGGLYKIKV